MGREGGGGGCKGKPNQVWVEILWLGLGGGGGLRTGERWHPCLLLWAAGFPPPPPPTPATLQHLTSPLSKHSPHSGQGLGSRGGEGGWGVGVRSCL